MILLLTFSKPCSFWLHRLNAFALVLAVISSDSCCKCLHVSSRAGDAALDQLREEKEFAEGQVQSQTPIMTPHLRSFSTFVIIFCKLQIIERIVQF